MCMKLEGLKLGTFHDPLFPVAINSPLLRYPEMNIYVNEVWENDASGTAYYSDWYIWISGYLNS